MKTATYLDAVEIGGILDLDVDTVWQIIRGMNLEIVSISSEGPRIHEECCRELIKVVRNVLSDSGERTE
jgi:hypothetical protein